MLLLSLAQAETVDGLLAQADPWLVALLQPAEIQLQSDIEGESPEVDLQSATVHLEGSVLIGEVFAKDILKTGAWFNLDTQGGPAPDLHVGIGDGWIRSAPMDGWRTGGAILLQGQTHREGNRLSFRVDLGPTGRIEAGHVGGAAVVVETGDQRIQDFGSAGVTGRQSTVQPLLEALAALPGDPDLAVAVALSYAPFYTWVQAELRPLVIEDALAKYRYGLELDAWLANKGLPWRLQTQAPVAKLLWAWPGGQSVAYGALPLAWQEQPLDLEHYRWHVGSIDMLTGLRDRLPLAASSWETADKRDAWIWQMMQYRGADGAMRALCRNGVLDTTACSDWAKEKKEGVTLGKIANTPIPTDQGISASFQWNLLQQSGHFVGDCATATSLAMAAYQAVGLIPLAMGYAGPDWNWPTHNQPFLLENGVFMSPQVGPSTTFAREQTYVYAVIPTINPYSGLALGWEPQGWARGGSVAGGWMSYGTLNRWWEEGISPETVMVWLSTQASGGWPVIR